MRVLIIDGNIDLANQIQRGLREQGFAVDYERSARCALFRAVPDEYDLLHSGSDASRRRRLDGATKAS